MLTKAKAPAELIRIIFQSGQMPRSVYDSFQTPETEVDADTLYVSLYDSRSGQQESASYNYTLMHEGIEIG